MILKDRQVQGTHGLDSGLDIRLIELDLDHESSAQVHGSSQWLQLSPAHRFRSMDKLDKRRIHWNCPCPTDLRDLNFWHGPNCCRWQIPWPPQDFTTRYLKFINFLVIQNTWKNFFWNRKFCTYIYLVREFLRYRSKGFYNKRYAEYNLMWYYLFNNVIKHNFPPHL